MLDLTYQHQATTQLYVQALIGIFFWLALRDISIYADMTLAAIIYLGMLTLIRQILTRRFRLYAYKQLVEILVLYNFKGTGPLRLICVFLTILKPRHTVPDVAPPKFPLFCSFVGQSFYCPRWQCKHPLVAEFQ